MNELTRKMSNNAIEITNVRGNSHEQQILFLADTNCEMKIK
jgi:hypothetical protein